MPSSGSTGRASRGMHRSPPAPSPSLRPPVPKALHIDPTEAPEAGSPSTRSRRSPQLLPSHSLCLSTSHPDPSSAVASGSSDVPRETEPWDRQGPHPATGSVSCSPPLRRLEQLDLHQALVGHICQHQRPVEPRKCRDPVTFDGHRIVSSKIGSNRSVVPIHRVWSTPSGAPHSHRCRAVAGLAKTAILQPLSTIGFVSVVMPPKGAFGNPQHLGRFHHHQFSPVSPFAQFLKRHLSHLLWDGPCHSDPP